MYKRINNSKYQEDVCNILHSVGMDKMAAQELTFCYPEYFDSMSSLKYQLPIQVFRLISALVFLEHLLTKCFKPHYSIYHYIESINAKLISVASVYVKRERVEECYLEASYLVN